MDLGRVENIAPVFVVGAGRSGTTALQLALNCHPKLAIFGETAAFSRYRKYGKLSRRSHLRRFLRDWKPSLSTWSRHDDLVDDPDLLDALRKCTNYAEAVNVMLGSFAIRESKPVWGEKTPAHILWLREIRQCFPHARVVHIIRDPRGVVASGVRAFHQGEFSEWNVYYYTRYWLRCMAVHGQEKSTGDSKYMSVKYEDLVTDGEATLRAVCQFLGVTFAPEMVNFSKRSEDYSPKDAKGNILAHQRMTQRPLEASRSEAWLQELAPRFVTLIERVAHDEMAALGYRAVALDAAPATRLFYLRWRWQWTTLTQDFRKVLTESYWSLRVWLER